MFLLVLARTVVFLCFTGQASPLSPQKTTDPPRLSIESFACSSAYAVGTQLLTFSGTIRNSSRDAIPAGSAGVRIYSLSGLDYTEGDTMPKLPALEPNASVSFKWRLLPTAPDIPIVAALALELPGRAPEVRITSVQHFPDVISADSAAFTKEATARSVNLTGVLENASVRVRVVSSEANVPALLFSSRTATGWRRFGSSMPIAEVCSSEGGQHPWWEVFRLDRVKAASTKGEASLTLTGGFGLRWRATVVLTARTDSSVIDARIAIVPLKPLKLSGVRFAPLMAGDGGMGSGFAENLPAESVGFGSLAAVRWGPITLGTIWLDSPSLDGWKAAPRPNAEGLDYQMLGAEWRPEGLPSNLNQANVVEFRTRIFALTPSASVADAHRVAPPPKPGAP